MATLAVILTSVPFGATTIPFVMSVRLPSPLLHIITTCLTLLAGTVGAPGQETVCATVKIEIQQEVTLARQAFEAKLIVKNTLPEALTNFGVQIVPSRLDGTPVGITADPTDTSALFFYRADGTHPTTIDANSSPTLEWTLIPSPTRREEIQNWANPTILAP